MPNFPGLLFPLLSADYPTETPLARFLHESVQLFSVAESSAKFTWAPPSGTTYIILSLTYSRAREFFSGDIILTSDFGFYHKHDQDIVYHWNPALESVLNVEENHYAEVQIGNPLELYFYNNTLQVVVFDYTVWLLQVENERLPTVRQYLRGILNNYLEKGKM